MGFYCAESPTTSRASAWFKKSRWRINLPSFNVETQAYVSASEMPLA